MMRLYERPDPLVDVLEEYIEEAAFLRRACAQCVSDPEMSWEDLPRREARLEVNLDGLVVGGRSSAPLLKPLLVLDEDGDPGVTFTAAAVIPSLGLVEPMEWLLEAIAADPPHRAALIDGLRYNRSDTLTPWLFDFLKHENAAVRAAGAEVLGARGVGTAADALSALVAEADPRVSVAAQIALARLGRPAANENLLAVIASDDAELAHRAAAESLARGEPRTLARLREHASRGPVARQRRLLPLLAVCGDARDVETIRRALHADAELADALLLALGFCGHPGVVEDLIDYLGRPENGPAFTAAYQALRTISGLDALPRYDLDEPGADDVRAYQDVWKGWWHEHGERLSPDRKWRRGVPLSPLCLAEDLVRTGNTRRDLTYLELRLRYACPIGFDPDGPFIEQAAQLAQIREWAARADPSFEPGRLYVYGNPAR